jgi:hypothetical protein
MDELRDERFLRICFIDDELMVDVNSDVWEEILNQRENIVRIETYEWTWDLLTGQVIFR